MDREEEQERDKEALTNKGNSFKEKRKSMGLLLISRPECSNLRGRLR